MAKSTKRRSPARIFFTLGSILLVTSLAIVYTIFENRSTVVELKVLVARADLSLIPPQGSRIAVSGADAPAPLRRIAILDSLESAGLKATDFGVAKAKLRGEEVALRPVPGLGDLELAAAEAFQPHLTAYGPLRLSVQPWAAAEGENVTFDLTPEGPLGGEPAWTCRVDPGASSLTLEQLEAIPTAPGVKPTGSGRMIEGTYEIPDDPTPLQIEGGPRPGRITLALKARRAPATIVRVLDPATGELSKPHSLPVLSPTLQAISYEHRLVLLEPDSGDTGPLRLLEPDLKVRKLDLFRLDRFDHTSYLRGGEIRFPLGEKPPVTLEQGFFLSIDQKDPLTLRSMSLVGGGLELVLWGKPSSIALGPTPEFQSEVLPSMFEWLYTHRLRTLVYSTLAWIVGISFTIFRMMGFMDS